MTIPSQRSILITGCSSGIGYHAAHTLQKRGYQVFATAPFAEEVHRLNEEGLFSLQLNLDDSSSIQHAVDLVMEQTGGTLYALFNNGGYTQLGAVEDVSRDVLRKQFETNLFGTHELTCAVLPIMRAQGEGRIIQNTSLLGLVCMPWRGAYNASKYALEALTDTMRMELRDTNIKFSMIEPGLIASKNSELAFEKLLQNINLDNSPHRELYQSLKKAVEQISQTGQKGVSLGSSPELVVNKLIHALEAKNPKIRYYVTYLTYFLVYSKWLLPQRAMDWLLWETGNG